MNLGEIPILNPSITLRNPEGGSGSGEEWGANCKVCLGCQLLAASLVPLLTVQLETLLAYVLTGYQWIVAQFLLMVKGFIDLY